MLRRPRITLYGKRRQLPKWGHSDHLGAICCISNPDLSFLNISGCSSGVLLSFSFIGSLLCYLQQQLYTLVKEKFLSTLGSWICPIEQTPVIIQVASQLLPRVTPEKIHIEVSHCLGLDQDTCLYTPKHLLSRTMSSSGD